MRRAGAIVLGGLLAVLAVAPSALAADAVIIGPIDCGSAGWNTCGPTVAVTAGQTLRAYGTVASGDPGSVGLRFDGCTGGAQYPRLGLTVTGAFSEFVTVAAGCTAVQVNPGPNAQSTTGMYVSVYTPDPTPTPTATPTPTPTPTATPTPSVPAATPTPAPLTCTDPCTVALTTEDRDRLDLNTWAVVFAAFVTSGLLGGILVTTGLRR